MHPAGIELHQSECASGGMDYFGQAATLRNIPDIDRSAARAIVRLAMTDTARKPFSYRAFWSLLAAVSGAGLPWTGLEVHLHQEAPYTPAGHAWMAAHTAMGVLFAIAATAHLVLNWRPLVRYTRGLAGRLLTPSREVLVAVAITAGLLLVAVGHTGLD